MNLFKTFSLFAAVTLTVFACKDKEDNDDNSNNIPAGKTKQELISLKNWKISALVTSGTDLWNTPFIDACNKDNQYRFRGDDSVSVYDMSNKCSGTDPDSSVGYYKLYNNNTQIILNLKLTSTNTLNDTAEIAELSETMMKLNAEYSGMPATISFIHP